MSIIKIGGMFNKNKDLSALKKLKMNDQALISAGRYTVPNDLPVMTSIKISGAGTEKTAIAVPDHMIGLQFTGKVELEDLTIHLSDSSVALVLDSGSSLSMKNVNVIYSGKFSRIAEYNYGVFLANKAPESITIENCYIEQASFTANNITITDSFIGHPYLPEEFQSKVLGNITSNNTMYINTLFSATGESNNDTFLGSVGLIDGNGAFNINDPKYLAFSSLTKKYNLDLTKSQISGLSSQLSYLNPKGTLKKEVAKNTVDDYLIMVGTEKNIITFNYSGESNPYMNLAGHKLNVHPLAINGVAALTGFVPDGTNMLYDTNVLINGELALTDIVDPNLWVKMGGKISIKNADVNGLAEKKATRNTSGLPESYNKLDPLIGLDKAKETVKEFITQVRLNKEREASGQAVKDARMHLLFEGSAGTGKTTVAKMLGEILFEAGVLKSSKVFTHRPADFIKGYRGQSGEHAKELIFEAINAGGILFIDEAYGLTTSDNDGENDFSGAVINLLVETMETHYRDFIVILAGYPDKMEKFLESNEGLASRLSNVVLFEDYNSSELMRIAELNFNQYGQKFESDQTREILANVINNCYKRNWVDGNARWVENLIQQIYRSRDMRISELPNRTEAELSIITTADIKSGSKKYLTTLGHIK